MNPKPFLKSLLHQRVVVRLKWNRLEYAGTLVAVDNYMNLQLENARELADHGTQALEEIGDVFVRCNNVLFVRAEL